jgi:hypothetical protein
VTQEDAEAESEAELYEMSRQSYLNSNHKDKINANTSDDEMMKESGP